MTTPPPPSGNWTPPAGAAPVPPAPAPVAQHVTVPPLAWLVPLAALLAVIGAFTPWFRPELHKDGRSAAVDNALYSWKDGKIGLVAPILLVILAIGVAGLLVGRTPARFTRGGAHPVASAGKAAIVAGVISVVCMIIAWFLVIGQYEITDPTTGSKTSLKSFASSVGATTSQGPQVGYWLTGAGAVLAIVAGVLMIAAARKATGTAGFQAGPPAPPGVYPPPAPSAPGAYQQQPPRPAPGGYQQPVTPAAPPSLEK